MIPKCHNPKGSISRLEPEGGLPTFLNGIKETSIITWQKASRLMSRRHFAGRGGGGRRGGGGEEIFWLNFDIEGGNRVSRSRECERSFEDPSHCFSLGGGRAKIGTFTFF